MGLLPAAMTAAMRQQRGSAGQAQGEPQTLSRPRRTARALRRARLLLARPPGTGYCTVCGRFTLFLNVSEILRESLRCLWCGAISRNRHVAKVLSLLLGAQDRSSLRHAVSTCAASRRIYEAQASGPIHAVLRRLPGYVCSEYLPDVAPGQRNAAGVRCEDLQALTFPDDTFDFVITQDVLEHVRDPEAAWREIHRVLRPGGAHVFTVPYDRNRPSIRRIELVEGREVERLPRLYHCDGIRDGLVYTEFGNDLPAELERLGFAVELHWWTEEERRRQGIVQSWVFVARKRSPAATQS